MFILPSKPHPVQLLHGLVVQQLAEVPDRVPAAVLPHDATDGTSVSDHRVSSSYDAIRLLIDSNENRKIFKA